MQHEMNLNPRPFDAVANGTKSVEMRLFDERRQKISVGDVILFTNVVTKQTLVVDVVKIDVFANFEELYLNFDKIALGYAPAEVAHPTDMLEYYTKEQIAQYGVVAISIKLQN